MHKVCFKCGAKKHHAQFYRHPGMADGRLNKCRDCTRADVSANYRKHRDHYITYEAKRFQNPKRKAAAKKYSDNLRRRNPMKYRAHYLTTNAVRDGRLIRQPCEVCGAIKSEAHHDDYRHPLVVRWLCRVHHLAHHGKVAY